MIRIKIDRKDVEIYDFDDGIAVLRRYVIAIGQAPQVNMVISTLPQFLRFRIEPDQFKESITYAISDVRNELRGMDIREMAGVETLSRLQARYPLIDRKTIGSLWLLSHGYSKMTKTEFVKDINEQDLLAYLRMVHRSFVNGAIIYDDMSTFVGDATKKWEDIRSSVQRESRIYDTLNKADAPKIEPFDLEETIEDAFVRLPDGQSLYDVFDAFNVSREIPYIMLVDGEKTFSKVFSDIPPPDEWVLRTIPPGTKGIYFYVLDSPVERLQGGNVQIEKFYSSGLWREGNAIRLALKLNSNETPKALQKKIFAALGDRIKYALDETMQMGVRGKFSIPGVTFNRAVFADLIFNNPAASYFFFIDEREKSSLHKPRFTFYYAPNQKGVFATSLTITITPVVVENDTRIDVRVARATTMKQIQSFMSIFQRVYGLYLERHNVIVREYKNLYAAVNFDTFVKKPPKQYEDKKTGPRLVALKKHNPDAFKEGYSSRCQPRHRQPYLVRGQANLDRVRSDLKKIPDDGPVLQSDGVLNWPRGSKDWYACYPRDADEDDKRYIWPGVIAQKEAAANYVEYPFLPCCFLGNQYTKKGGQLVRYLSLTREEGDDDGEAAFDETIFDRPLGPKKAAPRGRFAELPYYMQIVAASAGYKFIEDKRKKFLPIIRHGVVRGPASFVHCMEKAMNIKYSSMTIEGKRNRVKKVLDEISKLPDFTIGRQEMFDISDEEIREHLVMQGAYIDPDMYVTIFAKYYKCNIILFQVDDDYPGGELVIPRHAVAYLSRKTDPALKTVIIVKYGVPREWSYQCELVVKYKKGRLGYFFENDPIVTLVVKLVEEINTVYFTSTSGRYRKYVPRVQ